MIRDLARAACAMLLFGVAIGPAAAKAAGPTKSGPAVQVTLKQQLEQGLKCRRPIEFQFVDRVAILVEQGKLPIKLVNICYDWSLKRSSSRPWVYFQRSLTELAKRQGFAL
ncbi:MAG: hypothetical protein HYX69_04275 [Planctomycetia bacterium]|nr:hypothetical protein [Planctomycetia bacterium]